MVRLDGSTLTLTGIGDVADGDLTLEIAPVALARVAASAALADDVASRRAVYGRSTGVGANRAVILAPGDDDAGAGAALLRSHATSAGPLRAAQRVRATLVVRLNQLLAGGSGARPATVQALAELLRSGALPPVRELGSLGTGDLTVLATVALTLTGELAPTSGTAPAPVHLGLADALPLLSSNAATLADAALALRSVTALAHRALAVAATTFVAVDGNLEAYSVPVETVTPFDGARTVCRTMRAILGPDRVGARIQDPFALRTLPQVHGPLLDALARATDVVTRLVNAPAENPVFLPVTGVDVAHHGGFHGTYVTQAMDAVRVAVVATARLAAARLAMLTEPTLTGLPTFLGDGRPGASGILAVEYVAASAVGTLHSLAAPAGLQTTVLSRGVEEDASHAQVAARRALEMVAVWRTVLAAELVAAERAVRMRGLAVPDAVVRDLGPGVATDDADRDLTGDILAAEARLAQ